MSQRIKKREKHAWGHPNPLTKNFFDLKETWGDSGFREQDFLAHCTTASLDSDWTPTGLAVKRVLGFAPIVHRQASPDTLQSRPVECVAKAKRLMF